MSYASQREHAAITNASYYLRSVVEIVEAESIWGKKVLRFKDQEGHTLWIGELHEQWEGQHERMKTKRYRCHLCPK